MVWHQWPEPHLSCVVCVKYRHHQTSTSPSKAGKFILSELQKDYQRARLAQERAALETTGQVEDAEAADMLESGPSRTYNGFTLFLKEKLSEMVPMPESVSILNLLSGAECYKFE